MTFTCGDCGRKFFIDMRHSIMLPESIKRNPKLKIVCPVCGYGVVLKYIEDKKVIDVD